MGEGRAAAAAEHADPVGVVGHQPGVVGAGNPRERRKRREVAVHGKDAVGQDERPRMGVAVLGEKGAHMVDVVMAEGEQPRAAQLGAAPQAGMRELVDQEEVFFARQGWNDAEIGQITGAEHAGALGSLEPGEAVFQLGIERVIAGDEPRGPGADPVARERLARRRNDRRVLGEIEIVVAGKGDQLPAVAFDQDVVRPRRARQLAPQACPRKRVELRPGE